jgi:hypothetical protein
MKQSVFCVLCLLLIGNASAHAMPTQDDLPWAADYQTKSVSPEKSKNLKLVEDLCPKEPEACEWLVNFYSQVVSDSKNGGQLSVDDPLFKEADQILNSTYAKWCTSIDLGDPCRRYLFNTPPEVAVPRIKAARCKDGEYCQALVGYYSNRSGTDQKNLMQYQADSCEVGKVSAAPACAELFAAWPEDCQFITPLRCRGLEFKPEAYPTVYLAFAPKLEKGDRNELLGMLFAVCLLLGLILMIGLRITTNRVRLTRLQFMAWRWTIYAVTSFGLLALLVTGIWLMAIFYGFVAVTMIFDKIQLKLFCDKCFHFLFSEHVGTTTKSVNIKRIRTERDWRGDRIGDLLIPGKGFVKTEHYNTHCPRCNVTTESAFSSGEVHA